MKFWIVGLALLALGGCQSSARMRWDRIGPGPEFEQAQAQCNILAMGVGQNTIAVGSPGFVAGAAIGDALATGMQQQSFIRNCMVLQGWKQVPDVRGTSVSSPRPGMAADLDNWARQNNACIAGDTAACSKRATLGAKLKAAGVSPTG